MCVASSPCGARASPWWKPTCERELGGSHGGARGRVEMQTMQLGTPPRRPPPVSSWRCVKPAQHAMPPAARHIRHGGAGGKTWGTGSGRCCRPSCPAPRSSRSVPCGGACVRHGLALAARGSPLRAAGSSRADGVAGDAGQVGSDGAVRVVSGAGGEGTSRMALSGGKGLGTEGAQRLAELLREAPPPMLEAMDLRCPHPLP